MDRQIKRNFIWKRSIYFGITMLGVATIAQSQPIIATVSTPGILITPHPNVLFPFMPAISINGYGGNGLTGWADGMFPLWGHWGQFLYSDVQGQIHNDEDFAGSTGLGHRWLTQKAGIVGAYLFGDYNHAPDGHAFWFISPGIERFGESIDFSANIYVPVSPQRHDEGIEWSDDTHDSDDVEFEGHKEFSGHDLLFESVGLGADAEVGYRLAINVYHPEVFVGWYHSQPKDADSINGASVRVEIPLFSRSQMMFSEAYDKVEHNTFKVGISVTLGSRRTDYGMHTLGERMMEPVRRNLISVAGDSLGTNQPILQDLEEDGVKVLKKDSIWFFNNHSDSHFNPQDAENSCTFDHPCEAKDFNANSVDIIHDIALKPNFYFTSGKYALHKTLTLPKGSSLWGREKGYAHPASEEERPTFLGGFKLTRDNSLHNLNISGRDTAVTTGVEIAEAEDIDLDQITVSHYQSHDSNSPDVIGIHVENGSNIHFSGVTVSDIHGKNGNKGDNGQDGKNNNNQGSSVVVGENGTHGIDGGNGGNATGIFLNHVQKTSFKKVTVQDIVGGKGGDAGRGGNGGSANDDASAHLFNKTAISNPALAGTGGNGGNGGNGGQGGTARGLIIVESSQLTMKHTQIENLLGGEGGKGGLGGYGGSANAKNGKGGNTELRGETGGLAGKGGHAGAGGNGGNGGEVMGIFAVNETHSKADDTQLIHFNGGKAGCAGDGNNGGNADATHNQGGDVHFTGKSGNIFIFGGTGGVTGTAGNGGNGGVGGNGGSVTGIAMTDSEAQLTHTILSQFQAGNGNNGGKGGNMGSLNLIGNRGGNANNNDIDHNNAAIAGMGGIVTETGIFLTAGNGGLGGNGGEVLGTTVNHSKISMEHTTFSQFTGGDGKSGGDGGMGLNSLVTQNQSGNASIHGREEISVGGSSLGNESASVTLSSSNGGNGAQGGNGGSVTGVKAFSNSSVTMSKTHMGELDETPSFLGGSGGNGGNGGIGTKSLLEKNAGGKTNFTGDLGLVNSAAGGSSNINNSLGGNGGQMGNGADVTGIDMSDSSANLSTTSINGWVGGDSGKAGTGGIGAISVISKNTTGKTLVTGSGICVEGQNGGTSHVVSASGGSLLTNQNQSFYAGNVMGINASHSDLTLKETEMSHFKGGNGRQGGTGGMGAESVADSNATGDIQITDPNPTSKFSAGIISPLAGGESIAYYVSAGSSGMGASGGNTTGINLMNNSVGHFTSTYLSHFQGGNGGNGGAGATGSVSKANHNVIGKARISGGMNGSVDGNAAVGGFSSTDDISGGEGGNGGNGGEVSGFRGISNTQYVMKETHMSDFRGGKGGKGGKGGIGIISETDNNQTGSVDITGNSGIIKGYTGGYNHNTPFEFSDFSQAGSGGNGGTGGKIIGLNFMTESLVNGKNTTMTDFIGGEGGQGGEGGLGLDSSNNHNKIASAIITGDNASLNRGSAGESMNSDINGGSGGNGNNGGAVIGIIIHDNSANDNSNIILSHTQMERFEGGKGGQGGKGGAGIKVQTNENDSGKIKIIRNDRTTVSDSTIIDSPAGFAQNQFISANNGGTDGKGGATLGFDVVNLSDNPSALMLTATNTTMKEFAGGQGGKGGKGGSVGYSEVNKNKASEVSISSSTDIVSNAIEPGSGGNNSLIDSFESTGGQGGSGGEVMGLDEFNSTVILTSTYFDHFYGGNGAKGGRGGNGGYTVANDNRAGTATKSALIETPQGGVANTNTNGGNGGNGTDGGFVTHILTNGGTLTQIETTTKDFRSGERGTGGDGGKAGKAIVKDNIPNQSAQASGVDGLPGLADTSLK